MPKGIRACRVDQPVLGDQRRGQSLWLPSLHRSLQQPLPTTGMHFKEDMCRWQLGSSETLPRARSSIPWLESPGSSAQAGLVQEWEVCWAMMGHSLLQAVCDIQPGRRATAVWGSPR